MDFFDALNELRKENPDCSESEPRSALDSEIKAEEERLTGRNKYGRAVEIAQSRMREWLKSGTGYGITLDWRGIARFHTNHRPATVYAEVANLKGKEHAIVTE